MTLLLLIYPAYVSVKRRRQSRVAWKFVLLHSIAFAVASLTEVPFIRNNWTSVFLIFGIVFFIWMMHENAAPGEKQAAQ